MEERWVGPRKGGQSLRRRLEGMEGEGAHGEGGLRP